MLRLIVKRILWLIPVILVVAFVVFALLEVMPGTFVDTMSGNRMTPEDYEALRSLYNLDKPMVYRYALYMYDLVQGDLGISYVTGGGVWDMYMSRLPNTLILSFTSLIIGSVAAVLLGNVAARHAGKLIDNVATTFSLIGMSMPGFWLGLLLLLVFSLQLGWLPAGGAGQGIRSLILPAICSSFMLMATTTRLTRSSMLEVLNADFLRTARAKGVPEKAVIRKHALGNAWIPILTSIGVALSMSLAGSVIVESVFDWPGVGRLATEALRARDVPSILGCVILTTILNVLVLLAVDILYAFVDPRIKSQYSAKKKKLPGSSLQALISGDDSDAGTNAGTNAGTAAEVTAGTNAGTNAEVIAETTGETIAEIAVDNRSAPLPAEAALTDNYAQATNYQTGDYAGDKSDAATVVAEVYELRQEQGQKANSFVTRDFSHNTGFGKAAETDGAKAELLSRKYRKRSQFGYVIHHLRQNKAAVVGACIVVALLVVFIASLFVSYETVTEMDALNRFAPPSLEHPFGTDGLGRDAFLRAIYGTRYSLAIGVGVVGIAAVFGVLLGSVAGYKGGAVDDIIMRVSDTLASIPGMLLGMVIVTVLGQSLQNLIIAVGIPTIPIFIRITRASILSIKNNEYVEASRAIGFTGPRIIFTQVLPNGLAPIIVSITASLGIAILTAAALSFLGFGVPVPQPEWGAMISSGREFVHRAPWLQTYPGLLILITVLAFNLLGDGLRDALDPKLKK